MNAPRRHPLVKCDIEQAARYYEGKKPGLGTDFTEEVPPPSAWLGKKEQKETEQTEKETKISGPSVSACSNKRD